MEVSLLDGMKLEDLLLCVEADPALQNAIPSLLKQCGRTASVYF